MERQHAPTDDAFNALESMKKAVKYTNKSAFVSLTTMAKPVQLK